MAQLLFLPSLLYPVNGFFIPIKATPLLLHVLGLFGFVTDDGRITCYTHDKKGGIWYISKQIRWLIWDRVSGNVTQ